MADPKNANAINNLAAFLHVERRDLDRAQEMYEAPQLRPIPRTPPLSAISRTSFAWTGVTLTERRRCMSAQSPPTPKDAAALGSVALFLLRRVRHDFCEPGAGDAASARSRPTPKNTNNQANFAHILFLAGRRPAAIERLREAAPTSRRRSRAHRRGPRHGGSHTTRAVHLPEERDEALRALRALVAGGAAVGGMGLPRARAPREEGWRCRRAALLRARRRPLGKGGCIGARGVPSLDPGVTGDGREVGRAGWRRAALRRQWWGREAEVPVRARRGVEAELRGRPRVGVRPSRHGSPHERARAPGPPRDRASGTSPARASSTADLAGADLAGANLSGANLRGAEPPAERTSPTRSSPTRT